MAFDYSEIADVADEILEEFGQAVTLTHTNEGTYVPGTGWVPADPAEIVQAGTGATFDYGTAQAGIYSVPGSLVQVGDKQLLLSSLTTAGGTLMAPVNGDTITDIAGKVWTITQVKTVSPAGTAVLYDCNLRGA